MVGAILGLAAIFGVSEVLGEVYHDWNYDHEKNVVIKAGKKLADCTEVIEDKTAEVKNKITTKHEYNKACSTKQLLGSNESLIDALAALDKQIEVIKDDKAADILAAEAELIVSVVKVCNAMIKDNKLPEEDIEAIKELKAKGTALANQLAKKEITNQGTAKSKIKSYVNSVQLYINKNLELNQEVPSEDKSGETNDGATPGTFSTEKEAKIPDFSKGITQTLKVSDIKDTANNQ